MTYTEPKRCPVCDEPESLCVCQRIDLVDWMLKNPSKAARRFVEAEHLLRDARAAAGRRYLGDKLARRIDKFLTHADREPESI